MIEETAHDAYLRLRKGWHSLLSEKGAPMRSPRKDRLFDSLTRAWNRMSPVERQCAGLHCKLMYH